MNSKVFASFKLLFQVFGFENLNFKYDFTSPWLTIHSAFVVVQFVMIIKYWNFIVYTHDSLGEASDALLLIYTMFSYSVAIFVSWRHKKIHQNIFGQLKNVEVITEKFYVNMEEVLVKLQKKYKRKFVFLICFQLYALAQELVNKRDEDQSFRFFLVFSFPTIFCTVKHLHGIFYIDLNNMLFSVLNDQLLQLQDLILINELKLKSKKYSNFLTKRLKLCRNFYRTLMNVNGLQNECMGTFYLVNYINMRIHIIGRFYWIIFRIINQHFKLEKCMDNFASYNDSFMFFFCIKSCYLYDWSLLGSLNHVIYHRLKREYWKGSETHGKKSSEHRLFKKIQEWSR